MKKTIKLLLILVLIAVQIFIMPSSSFATGAEIGDKFTLKVIKKIDGITMSYYGQEITPYFTVYTKNGVDYPVYCVDYFLGGVTDTKTYEVQVTEEYVNENSTDVKKIGVWKAILNGYPFKSFPNLSEDEAYAATKQAVFCMLYDRTDWSLYHYEGDAGKRVYDAMIEIVNAARSSSKVPQSTTISLSETEWKIDELNKEYLSKKITLNCATAISSFRITLEGNVPEGTIVADLNNNELTEFKNCKEFKVLVPLEKLVNENQFRINVNGQVSSYPMYFGQAPASNLQSYVLTAGILKQESTGVLTVYPENKTRILIKKQDKEGNVLEGVKFNIFDNNKNIVYESVETNKEGIIEVNNMIPGTYYLREIETIEGYEINNDLIEFSIELDEEKEIIVENEKIPEEPEPPEEPDVPEIPEIPEEPKIPETPETPIVPTIPPEVPTLPRTGY